MDYVFDYTGKRSEEQLIAFITHVKEHGFGVLQLFGDKSIKRIEHDLDDALFNHSGIKYGEIISGDDDVRNRNLCLLGGIRKSSVTSQIFYTQSIFDVMISRTMKHIFDSLFKITYKENTGIYSHPFKWHGDNSVPFLDRMGFRLPSWIPQTIDDSGQTIGPENGLGLHVDQNPFNPYLLDKESISHLYKWRPFQSFVTVSDHTMYENGGLCVVPDFHKKADSFWSGCNEIIKMEQSEFHSGEFYRMHHYDSLECIPILAPAGSLVLWDTRLPHKTTLTCQNPRGRKMIYGSWLPDIEINQAYMRQQKKHYKRGILPPSENYSKPCYIPKELILNEFQKLYLSNP